MHQCAPYKHARIDDTTEHSTHKSKEKEKKNRHTYEILKQNSEPKYNS